MDRILFVCLASGLLSALGFYVFASSIGFSYP